MDWSLLDQTGLIEENSCEQNKLFNYLFWVKTVQKTMNGSGLCAELLIKVKESGFSLTDSWRAFKANLLILSCYQWILLSFDGLIFLSNNDKTS